MKPRTTKQCCVVGYSYNGQVEVRGFVSVATNRILTRGIPLRYCRQQQILTSNTFWFLELFSPFEVSASIMENVNN